MSSRVIDDEVLVKVLQGIDELFDFDEYDLNDDESNLKSKII